MPVFRYHGITREGKRLQGEVSGPDVKLAETELKNRGIEIIDITLKQEITISFFSKKIKSKEIVLFTRYLSIMLSAGLPILQSLDIIIRDQANPTFKAMLIAIRGRVTAGATFSDSLNLYPKYFTPLYTNLIRAGEKSGSLDKVLKRLSNYLEKIEAIRAKIRNALIYPIAILVITTLVATGLLVFVMPQFKTIFQNAGAHLPAFTQVMLNLSDFVRGYWYLIIIGIIAFVSGYKYLLQHNEKFADNLDGLKLRIYIFGTILNKAIIARYTRTLAITMESGMPIVDAMKSMVNIMGNRKFSKAIAEICDDLVSGQTLAVSMEETKRFPGMVIQMVSVGEAAGSLADMLNTIADYYEDEVDNIAANLSTLLEPVIIVILGFIVGSFVIAMYLPIFKLGSTI